MTEDEYSYYYDKKGLVVKDNKMEIYLGENGELFSEIINIEYKKEDKEVLIELANGKQIEIYFHDNGKLEIASD